MSARQRLTPEETANRILDVAEEHFRRVGYGKTAIADLADELGMSSANIYRYFASKSAINEAICRRLLAESDAIMREIAARKAPASARLYNLLLALHAFNKSRYTGERRMHEMVAVAMEEDWGVIREHMTLVVDTIAALIREGVAAGEFKPVADARQAAEIVKHACSCVMHPMMIAEHARLSGGATDIAPRLVQFVVDALKA